MLICNQPETRISEKLARREELSEAEVQIRKDESTNDVFVFAGYVEPGKHQIIIKDQQTKKYFAREIVVDARNVDIINCHTFET